MKTYVKKLWGTNDESIINIEYGFTEEKVKTDVEKAQVLIEVGGDRKVDLGNETRNVLVKKGSFEEKVF